ncbi:hypothetical protein ABH931_000445 [Streptacidiphilus sp. MAP12-33]|uniref:class F sortase n=1 Tax=Streptacidiphilus sp. MAP12-33 TaxID=3156266 RepID=UPI00351751FD
MADPGDRRAQDRRATLARAAALGAAVALVAGLAVGCAGAGAGAGHDGASAGASAVNVRASSALAPSVPDRIRIPAIKLDATLGTIGLQSDGTLETPPFDRPTQADWYRQGPTPGERGAAVIAGHMDTPQVPQAVFFRLKDLKKDQRIEITRDDGTTAVFSVDAVDTFKKDAFPSGKVYGPVNDAELRLITCGGSLTADRHWDSNVVVFAHLTGEATDGR